MGAAATRNVGDGETVSGNFAIPHQKFMQNLKESLK
jgi:UDP-3-O-[3-hydroxymyristoyl] glucosamine N-acyltransferase